MSQLAFSFQCYRNHRYALSKYKKRRLSYRPRTVLLVPCKGLDASFQRNIRSFLDQDYENYLLWFVVADESDPAYQELCKFKEQPGESTKAQDVQILLAGHAKACSQKIHNLLRGYDKIGDDVEILAFADSDVHVRTDWLSHLVWPLHKPKNGAASGYRWLVPKKNNLASLALSAINAKIAQLLGNTHFNQAWGGSMAIGTDTFRQVGLDRIWPKALSDDLSLSCAVKRAGKKIAFVPACLVASYESTTWRKLLEFGRRQFLITRVSAPRAWWFGFLSTLYSVLGLWAGAALAVYAAMTGAGNLVLFAAVPTAFFLGQLVQAILRQRTASKLLEKDRHRMRFAMAADIFACWLWSLLLLLLILSSAFGRTITWRGIRYKLLGPTETVVLSD